jgi:hypothetical protein
MREEKVVLERTGAARMTGSPISTKKTGENKKTKGRRRGIKIPQRDMAGIRRSFFSPRRLGYMKDVRAHGEGVGRYIA